MNEYNRPPTRMYVSSSCSIFVLTICSRVLRCWSEDSGRRRGIRSNINGFRERFTSRKISASVSRRTPIPVALSVCSTPDRMEPNSDRTSSCSRAVRWMHLFADRLKPSRLKRFVTALPKAAPGSS